MEKEKKPSNLSRLMGYAGNYQYFQYAAWVLTSIGALIALVPFWYIWRIIRDVLEVAPNYAEATNLTHYGWMAVLFAVAAMIVYIAGVMCGHISAFRIAANLRIAMMEHVAKLPLGYVEHFGSGKLRKVVNDSGLATENYLAHRLPDPGLRNTDRYRSTCQQRLRYCFRPCGLCL